MLAGVIPAVAGSVLFAGVLMLASRKPNFTHLKNTISELGEVGAPDQRLVAFGLFLPIGLSLLLVGYLVLPSSPPAAALALCIAIGYVGAAAFPCDPGSPISGSLRQSFHNLCGGVEYVGGGLALLTLAERSGQPFKAAGFLVLGAAFAMTFVPDSRFRGLIQRIAEFCLFGSLALAA